MDNMDMYLLLAIGILVVSVLAVEIVPMPQLPIASDDTTQPVVLKPKPPVMNSGARMSVLVLGTTALTTVNVEPLGE